MRVKFKRGLLIKLGLVTVVLLFTIPYFISRLDDTNKKESLKQKAWNNLGMKDLFPFNDPNKNVLANPLDVPANASNAKDGQKVYGPKAVFKKGVLGNYEPDYKMKHGPGESGEAVFTGMEEKSAADRSVSEFGFNMINSDKIAMDRTIPDTRMDECKYWHYPETSKLPTASVILVFHNEGWSTLMRTVHSVVNMSPPQLLEEVVMVDDFSDKQHLMGKLEDYIKDFNRQHGKEIVKLYRNKQRLGLIGTRTRGAELSVGDVIVFLDAHCECNRNWLVPLLARIAYDRTIMTVPIVDGVNWDNFAYNSVYGAATAHHRGIFEWGFLYKESQVPQKELSRREHNSEPYWSPTHAGGLFAMDRKYFFEMGAYDEGLQIWGGENFELSFKIWQCGGSIEWVPCSRVGHVYRNHMPYGFGKIDVKIPVILLNYMRVVEVWLDDDFKEYFYTREPSVRGYPVGDLTKQLKFKKEKNCKSFRWFMDNIAYEVYDKFPILPPNHAWGEIKQPNGMLCWDTLGQGVGGGPIGVSHCHHFGGSQMFRLNTKGQMGVGERCITSPNGDTLHMSFCATEPTGPWKWEESTGLIHNTDHNKCAEASPDSRLHLVPCDPSHNSQTWTINQIKTWQR